MEAKPKSWKSKAIGFAKVGVAVLLIWLIVRSGKLDVPALRQALQSPVTIGVVLAVAWLGSTGVYLGAEIDGLSATLATGHYTRAQTDGAISTAVSAAQTTLQSGLDDLSATLASTYYTKVETDGEIETAVSAVSLALSSEIGAA